MTDPSPHLPRILVVDDEPLIIRMLHEVLKPRYELQMASSGEEALVLASSDSPELILLDIGLPDLDGYEVCRRLRANESTRDVPVIFLTNHDTRKEVVRGFEAGGTDYVLKPFGVIELMARIDTHLRQHRQKLALEGALEQNRLLLVDYNARITNNLALVDTLLTLQSGLAGSDDAVRHLQATRHRIGIMADIHEILRSSGGQSGVDACPLLRGIGVRLIDISGRENIRLHVECDGVDLGTDAATPCGLVINELFANALQHAFPDGRPGTVTLALKREESDLVLTVGDDGVGLPEGLDPLRCATSGMTIVTGLVRQMNGRFEVERAQGTRFVIRLPAR